MGSFSSITLGDVADGAARYRPVAVAIAAVLLVLQLLPDDSAVRRPLAGGAAQVSGAARPAASTADAPAAPALDSTIDDVAPSFGPTVGPFASASDDSTGSGSDGAFTDSDSDFSTSDDFGTSTAPPAPLRIVAKAWATQTAGTPVASAGVPAGSLPVGKRLGQDDKRSFVRLSGEDDVLVLAEDSAGSRTTTGAVGVQACQITDVAWRDGEAMTFDQAPKYDARSCVAGTRADSGIWTFDLSGIPTRADQRGFALLPAAGSSVDFQVAMRAAP